MRQTIMASSHGNILSKSILRKEQQVERHRDETLSVSSRNKNKFSMTGV